jgi:tRNA(fMet)-specific endonuclease VapC
LPLLLDTSIAVDLIDQVPDILERTRQVDFLYLSVISCIELEAAVYRDGKSDGLLRRRVDGLLERVETLPFTVREVAAYSSIIAAKGFSRRLVVDRMIAATALANDLKLATLNARDLRDIPALTIEDWSAELI